MIFQAFDYRNLLMSISIVVMHRKQELYLKIVGMSAILPHHANNPFQFKIASELLRVHSISLDFHEKKSDHELLICIEFLYSTAKPVCTSV